MNNSRTLNSLRNTIIGVVVQLINIVLSFVTRTVFIIYLNIEYLGINALFSNILIILSLAELGFGSAIVYSMYKPIAEKEHKKIAALMNLYSKVYKVIGCIIGVLGLLIIPFLDFLIKEQPDIENFTFIYILFLTNTVATYFFSYKRSIITADQKDYILSKYKLYFSIIKTILQVLVLIIFQSFLLYLIAQIICTIIENYLISLKADKLYPFLKRNKREKLNKDEKSNIWSNIKALSIYKIGSTVLDGTDNIIISAFVGVVTVGKLSNYTLVTGALSMAVSQFTNAITASVGNFIVKENRERQEFLLRTITLVNFLIYGFSFVCLYFLMNPFISLWLGTKYILDENIVFVLALNFYIFGMMGSIWTFRSTMGLFIHGKYRPIISAILNVIISIILVKYIGVIGVLLGTTISRFVTNVWYDPLIVYNHGLQKSVKSYYIIWMKYLIVVMVDIVLISYITSLLSDQNIISFIIRAIICFTVTTSIFFLFIKDTEEYRYLYSNVKKHLLKAKS